jgi:hypothetical protein
MQIHIANLFLAKIVQLEIRNYKLIIFCLRTLAIFSIVAAHQSREVTYLYFHFFAGNPLFQLLLSDMNIYFTWSFNLSNPGANPPLLTANGLPPPSIYIGHGFRQYAK